MKAFVVDTNVPVVANGHSGQADPDCVIACINALEHIVIRGRIILDDGIRILQEYMTNLSMSGQPGSGDFFMKWVWQNQGVVERCARVTINEAPPQSNNFLEFPADPKLAAFDPSDRIFVAVCIASGLSPPVLNAVDSDWVVHETTLAAYGVQIQNLCPNCISLRA